MHDSQVAMPLATMTAGRSVNLYDLMDSAYGAAGIEAHSRALGHVPIIDVNPRRAVARKEEKALEAKPQGWWAIARPTTSATTNAAAPNGSTPTSKTITAAEPSRRPAPRR